MTGVAADPRADRWRARVTDTRPADRAQVEAGIRDCYRAAGEPPPRAVAWVRSPREAERLVDPHRRARVLERLTEPRTGRWRRRVRTRRRELQRSALRSAAVAGGLVLEVGLTVVAAAAGLLPVVLVAVPAGLYALLSVRMLREPGDFARWLWRTPLDPAARVRTRGSRRWRDLAHHASTTVLVLLLGSPAAIGLLAAWHGWRVATGAAGPDRTGPMAMGALAAAAGAALLGLLAGALAGVTRPGAAELRAVDVLSTLPARLRRYPGEVPAQLSPTRRAAVSWRHTGRDGGWPGPAGRHLAEVALSHRQPLLPLLRGAPWPVADLLHAYEQGWLGAADGRLVTAYADAGDAWLWWPSPGLVVACERPVELAFDPDAPVGELRLHCADGPAVRWRDGSVEHWWRGVPVPRGLVEGRWGVRRIRRERNSEVRRVALERMGWAEFVRRARLRPVSVAPDPGNPGRELRLYELPRGFVRDVRLLVMVNGSPDRDGRERVYAEAVPAAIADAVAAAAWQYGVPAETYARLRRRT